MSNIIHVDSKQSPIVAVSVFWVNRAEVQRVLSVDLKAGQNEVHLEKLPNQVDQDSIRVEGLGNAVIFDVIYKPAPPVLAPNPLDESQAALRSATKRLTTLQSEKKILEDKAGFLDAYSKTLNADKTDSGDLEKFLDLYTTEKGQINENLVKVEESIVAVTKEVQEERAKLSMDQIAQKRMVGVTVMVLAETEGPAELSISYVVSGASWTPMYDLRATVSPGSDSTSKGSSNSPSNVSLQYRASISQRTGEDWSSVDLTLSTASPLTSSTIPTLSPWRIGPPVVHSRKPTVYRGGLITEMAQSTQAYVPMAMVQATVQESATSATFLIEGKSNIPSGDVGGVDKNTHKVVIAVIDMSAKLEWVAVPKEQESAFLRCQVRNTSPYILLDGQASVFMDNNFVCKTTIPDVSPQESFSTSLGVDPSIRVTYHPLVKKTKAYSGNLGNLLALQNKSDITSHTQRLTIKNTRSSRVSPLFIRDQVPVSVDSAVKVLLNAPKELGEAKERKEVNVAAGVKARWAIKGREDDEDSVLSSGKASGVEEEGVVEWVCDVDSGKSIELTVAWDVIAPAGKTWTRIYHLHLELTQRLQAGLNEVLIERFPNRLDRDSIRVEGHGHAIILDVIYTSPTRKKEPVHNSRTRPSNTDSAEENALRKTEKHITAMHAERGVVKDQINMLTQYSTTLAANRVDHTTLAEFLNLAPNEKLQDLEENIQLSQETAKAQREALAYDDASGRKAVKVTVVVMANADGLAELSVSYDMQQSTPTGDRKDKPAGHGDSLSVRYRASITQSIGEDWTEVSLDLSTASPHLQTEIPTLGPYLISIPAPVETWSGKENRHQHSLSVAYYAAPPSTTSSHSSQMDEYEDDDEDEAAGCAMDSVPTLPRTEMAESRTVEGAISTNSIVRGRTTVPSDVDNYCGREHQVTIAEFDLDPKLEWTVVPKMQPRAFLRVSQGPGEKFSTSLGIDPALRVTYHPLVKKSKNVTGSKFLSLQTKTDVSSHIQRVSIKNTRLADVQLSLKITYPRVTTRTIK
ncbi:hypothetical protein FRB98_002193 [Tulasnella sp. 332]|nr:hypothetical protein FRB98_002193 [Tulasnella sp. 332]